MNNLNEKSLCNPVTRYIVKYTESNDIAGILEVLNGNLIINKQTQNREFLELRGFLIHGFTQTDIETAILDKQKNIILAAKENDEVVGYLLAYDLHTENPDWLFHMQVSLEIKELLATKKIAYYRHIAKKIGKKGVGKQLFKVFLEEAIARNYQYLICQIVHEPFRNKISLAFHEKLGFILIGTTKEEDRVAGLYLKKIAS